jgi:hypothetical protein
MGSFTSGSGPKRRNAATSAGGIINNRETWEHCWSAARFHFGLTDDDFFRLTPRQFHLLTDRHAERTQHQEYLFGILAAVAVNHSFNPPKKATVPGDFMPSLAKERQRRKPRENRKAIANHLRAFLMAQMKAQQKKGAK